MKQRAIKAGVLSNPYRFVEAGEEFDNPERMNWAEVVEEAELSESAPRRGRPRAKPYSDDASEA